MESLVALLVKYVTPETGKCAEDITCSPWRRGNSMMEHIIFLLYDCVFGNCSVIDSEEQARIALVEQAGREIGNGRRNRLAGLVIQHYWISLKINFSSESFDLLYINAAALRINSKMHAGAFRLYCFRSRMALVSLWAVFLTCK